MTALDLGLVGLGTMGANLARNFAGRGTRLALFDAAPAVARALARELAGATAADNLPELVRLLAPPRAILLMVPAGTAVDETIAAVLPELAPGDSIIDGGNSYFRDTERRVASAAARGVHVLGFGLSGGSEGARHGPSIMAGGDDAAVARIASLFSAIAARAGSEPCFAQVGPGGAGHFVKMLHNGIEYALMQLIAETYQLMRVLLGMKQPEIARAFATWEKGALGSFLVECARRVLDTKDPDSGLPLLELVEDRAGQKGTGRWAANVALEFGVAAPTIAEAVHARCLSALKEERVAAEQALGPAVRPAANIDRALLDDLGPALLAANIAVHAQGFALMAAAGAELGAPLALARVAKVWRAGCIIRSRLLEPIAAAYARDPALANLLRDPALWEMARAGEAAWRRVVAAAVTQGIAVPAFASALAYVDGYRTGRLWANMIAAQRDLFGAHGYGRVDRPGRFHSEWAAT